MDSLFAAASEAGLGPLLAGPAMLVVLSSLSFLRNLQARGAITRDSATYLAPLPLLAVLLGLLPGYLTPPPPPAEVS